MSGIFSQEDVAKLVRTKRRSGPKINFNDADSKILADYQNQISSMGFSPKALRERYKEVPFNTQTHAFGLGVGQMPAAIYSGNLGVASDYTNTRISVLNELISLFESAQSPEDLHKINALMQTSLEAADGDKTKAAHYKELIEAAKVAVSGDTEASKNQADYDKSFIYDPRVARKTLNELVKRREHLMAIQSQGFDSYEKHGFAGRIDQHGLTTMAQTAGLIVTGRDAWKVWNNFGDAKALWSGIRAAQPQTIARGLETFPLLGRAMQGASATGNLFGKIGKTLFGSIPGWGKALAFGAAAVWGVSKLVVAYNEKESFLHNVATTAKETFYGDANNGLAALASWVLPGFGTMYGTGYFTSAKQKELNELRTIGVAA